MTRFHEAFERLISHEGGYSNHPDDPGGETMYGITKRVAMQEGYDGPMRNLSRKRASEIYKSAYWDRAKADQYDFAIGFQLFDAAVNHGIGNAIRLLQRAVGTADDGIVGPMTLAAVDEMTVTDVLMRFNAERLDFYASLITFSTFGRGWTRRVAENLRHGATDA